jgi:hypothetical protein
MFSLCITTLNRWNFLEKNIPKYLENELISEIIVSDENGNDVKLIEEHFPNQSKLKLFKNDSVLGPFLNKIKCCKQASNEWIALIDSDNFVDFDYFTKADEYISSNISLINQESIIAPSMASPNFDYEFLANVILTKNNIKSYNNKPMFNCFINTGNYILNKNLIDNLNLNLERELGLIKTSSACDVKFMNTLFLEQFHSLNIHVVKNMKYQHVVHDESVYLKTHMKTQDSINKVNDRFNKCLP